MGLRWIRKNQVVLRKEVVDGLYNNLESRKQKIDMLNKVLEERNMKDAQQLIVLNELEKKWKEFHTKFDAQLDESLALASEVAALKAEIESLKKTNKSLKGYATKCKNQFEVIKGKKR